MRSHFLLRSCCLPAVLVTAFCQGTVCSRERTFPYYTQRGLHVESVETGRPDVQSAAGDVDAAFRCDSTVA